MLGLLGRENRQLYTLDVPDSSSPGASVISDPSKPAFAVPRHWWGKIIGAVLGLLKGGLSGALLGALAGHMVDRLVAGFTSQRHTRAVFFRSLFTALGQVCKADGRVTEVEIAAAENLMRRLELSDEERQDAIRCFNDGKATGFDLETALREFVQFTAVRHDLRQMFMEILIEGAAADGTVSAAEESVLFRVCRALHMRGELLSAMLAAYRATHHHGAYQGPQAAVTSLDQAYAALGLKENASTAEIKKAYRKLVSQYHPDRLESRGLPAEMMDKARNRVREINAAYDRLKAARGIK